MTIFPYSSRAWFFSSRNDVFHFLVPSNFYHSLEHEEIRNIQLLNLKFRNGGTLYIECHGPPLLHISPKDRSHNWHVFSSFLSKVRNVVNNCFIIEWSYSVVESLSQKELYNSKVYLIHDYPLTKSPPPHNCSASVWILPATMTHYSVSQEFDYEATPLRNL